MNRRLLAMTKARLLEVRRDRTAMLWNVLFAPLAVIAMATVFSGGPQAVAKVGVVGDMPLLASTHPFLGTPAVQFYREADGDKAIAKVQHRRIDLLLDIRNRPVRYWIDQQSDKGQLLRQILLGTDPQAQEQLVSGASISFADWLVPGLLAINITFTSLFAIGHVIVRYRKTGYLKRLNGTPLSAAEFISSQLIACLIMNVLVNAGIYAVCHALLHLRMEGSYLNLLLVMTLGSMSVIAMSLLIAARITSEEASGGLLALIACPMLTLSGVFFSLDGAPALVRDVAQLFPMTQMIEAARAVMLDGAGLFDIARPLLALCAMTALFLALGAGTFRWRQE